MRRLGKRVRAMWTNFFTDGGFGMYPTSIFGFVLVASAVLYVIRPERRYAAIVANATALTALSSVLGTAVGLITTFRYVQAQVEGPDQLKVALVGGAESLNNLVLGMILCVVGTLLALLASIRAARKAAGA